MKVNIYTEKKEKKDLIAWRGHEVTRIEAFSDAVFAFAITLLIISLEVPKNYEEFMRSMRGFIPFGISFMIFFQIWSTQNLYFRRYGMHDSTTLTLNAILLFVVLIFVYPLKFIWQALFFPQDFMIKEMYQAQNLFCIYSGGFAAIYVLFTLMHLHALRRAQHLKLTEVEIYSTKTNLYKNAIIAVFGTLSVIVASVGLITFAWCVYFFIGPAMAILHSRRRKQMANTIGLPENEPVGEELETE